MTSARDAKDLVKHLREQGFTVELVPNGHYKVTAPESLGGRKCQIAATPRERRTLLNAITRLKRIGYEPKSKYS